MKRVLIAAVAALGLCACAASPPSGPKYHVMNGGDGCVASPTPMPASPTPTEIPGGDLS